MTDTSEFRQDSFTHILIGDVVHAQHRVETNESPSARRDLIRAVFSGIEGLIFRLKRDLEPQAKWLGKALSTGELALIREESYIVKENGDIRSQPNFLTISANVRFIVKVYQRMSPHYEVDFTHCGWQALCRSISVRHRLTHPKSLEELNVSDEEIDEAQRGFSWLLALVIEMREEIIEQLRKAAPEHLRETFEIEIEKKKKKPDPATS